MHGRNLLAEELKPSLLTHLELVHESRLCRTRRDVRHTKDYLSNRIDFTENIN